MYVWLWASEREAGKWIIDFFATPLWGRVLGCFNAIILWHRRGKWKVFIVYEGGERTEKENGNEHGKSTRRIATLGVYERE